MVRDYGQVKFPEVVIGKWSGSMTIFPETEPETKANNVIFDISRDSGQKNC